MTPRFRPIERISFTLGAIFAIDRLLKMATVVHFFSKRRPSPPDPWPSVTLIQPITQQTTRNPQSTIRNILDARASLNYPARIQHLLVCDARDEGSQAVCSDWMARFPGLDAKIVEVDWTDGNGIAPKTVKLQTGLEQAECDVVCCVDDDIIMRPDTLRTMLPYLYETKVGAVFGLACYTDWSNLPSSLMSAFVNANALLTYIPATYLTEPFTITGHIFALRREALQEIDGFRGLEHNIGDDHQTARRIRRVGLRAMQTPALYDVRNHFDSMSEYLAQMKRWFVLPRQTLMPMMTPREQAITFVGSAPTLIPGVLALLVLLTRSRSLLLTLAAMLSLFCFLYSLCESLYAGRTTPLTRWPLVPLVALVAPAQIVVALLSDSEVEWRGNRIHIERGGEFSIVKGDPGATERR